MKWKSWIDPKAKEVLDAITDKGNTINPEDHDLVIVCDGPRNLKVYKDGHEIKAITDLKFEIDMENAPMLNINKYITGIKQQNKSAVQKRWGLMKKRFKNNKAQSFYELAVNNIAKEKYPNISIDEAEKVIWNNRESLMKSTVYRCSYCNHEERMYHHPKNYKKTTTCPKCNGVSIDIWEL